MDQFVTFHKLVYTNHIVGLCTHVKVPLLCFTQLVLFLGLSKLMLACKQTLSGIKGERKDEGPYAHLKFYLSAPF